MLCRVVRLYGLGPSVLGGFACGDEWMDDWLTRKAPRQLAGGLWCSSEGYRHYLPIRTARERLDRLGDDYFVFG